MSSESAKIKREKLIGKKFNRLTVIGFEFNEKRKRYYAKCKCDCGNITVVAQDKLKRGSTKSCGCHNSDVVIHRNKTILSKHNLSNHPAYHIWLNQVARCNNKNDKSYLRYGGRGIKCEYTLEEFCEWYDNNPKPNDDYSIDRIDNDGNYSLDNIRWANKYIQSTNRDFVKNAKHIYKTSDGKYKAYISIYGKTYDKTFNTEADARLWKDKMLKHKEELYFND